MCCGQTLPARWVRNQRPRAGKWWAKSPICLWEMASWDSPVNSRSLELACGSQADEEHTFGHQDILSWKLNMFKYSMLQRGICPLCHFSWDIPLFLIYTVFSLLMSHGSPKERSKQRVPRGSREYGGNASSLQTDGAARLWEPGLCERSQVLNVDSNVFKPPLQPRHNKPGTPAQDTQPWGGTPRCVLSAAGTPTTSGMGYTELQGTHFRPSHYLTQIKCSLLMS